MDIQWCLTCECHLENELDIYCSHACYQEAHPACLPSSPSRLDERIIFWRNHVEPGPPPSKPSSPPLAHIEYPIIRPSSPSSSTSSAKSRRSRPKLMQMATSHAHPSVSLSYSAVEGDYAPKPASPARDVSPRYLSPHRDISRRSSVTGTTVVSSDFSAVTPATSAAIPVGSTQTKMHGFSLWKQVRGWIGPNSPTLPRQLHARGVDGHFPAFSTNRKHPLILQDDELLDAGDFKEQYFADTLAYDERSDSDDDDESNYSCGLADWFAQRAAEQRQAKQAQVQTHANPHAERTAYVSRGRKLQRAEAAATFYALR